LPSWSASRWNTAPTRLRGWRDVLRHCASLHHEYNAPQRGDVFRRVAVDADQVGLEPGGYGADRVRQRERLSRERRRGHDRGHRRLAADLHPINQLFPVLPEGARDGVGAEHDAELGASQRLLEHCEYEGDRSMHLREPLLGVVLHAEKARLVVEVVLEHEVQVRIEERPVIGHEVEGYLIEQYAVLD